MGIHPCVFGLHFSVTLFPYSYFVFYILLACLSLLGNSPSYTYSEFTLCQALKLERLKIRFAPIHPPPSSCPIDPFNWYQSEGSLIELNRLRDYGRRGPRH
jgi:hypothetical protein